MKKIAENTYIESAYPGVLVGAVLRPRGLLLIDAPLRPDDGRAWLAALHDKGASNNRLLVNLDAHPDRTVGARALNATVIAHNETAAHFRSRSSLFKAQNESTGAAWESVSGLTGLRWLPPGLSLSAAAAVAFDDTGLLLEHHPGPQLGSLWVHLPEDGILFIGDTVPIKQPPFLAHADIEAWLTSLSLLSSKQFAGYTILSSRGGPITKPHIQALQKFLKDVKTRLDRLGRRKGLPAATEKIAANLFTKYKYAPNADDSFANRLRYGLHHYYTRRYRSNPKSSS